MRLTLPSSAVATLDEARARAAAGEAAVASPVEALRILRSPGVLALRARSGAVMTIDELPLVDLAVLRVALVRAGATREEPIDLACDNCDAPLRVEASAGVELAPFLDGELDDPELDVPFDFAAPRPIPRIQLRRGAARSLRLAPRTVGEAAPLLSRSAAEPLDLSPAAVAAMGVASLGPERRASALAAALRGASQEAWDEVVAHWEDAHGHPRLFASARCAACGARNDVPAPALRELSGPLGAPSARPKVELDVDAFEALVRRHADRSFSRRRIRNVDLVVDDGIPAVDDGGEPLLGCYTPPHTDPLTGVERAPEIRLFVRSFRAELEADPSFDLDGEVRETIDHELEHHENHLAGVDPLDDEERAVIAEERRRVVGRRESARRGLSAVGDELRGFLRVGWPLLLAGALATWWTTCR